MARASRSAFSAEQRRNDAVREVAEEVFARYGRAWKTGTVAVNRSYLRSQILPWFRDRPIGEITHTEVQRWSAGLHETPDVANRSLPILSVVLHQAEIYGYRRENSNPCAGVGWQPHLWHVWRCGRHPAIMLPLRAAS